MALAALAAPLAAPVLAAPETERAAPANAALARPVIAPAESWVLPALAPVEPDGAQGAGTVDLMIDEQARLIPGGSSVYRANQFRIATTQGLDDAALQLSWDPSLETLTLHHYRIRRGGTVIDLLGDGSALSVVRREKNLENAMLDGKLTASLQPDDVRVGDVIEVAYTRTRRDPAIGGRAELVLGPPDGFPLGHYRLRMSWPATRPVQWRAWPGVVQPRLSRQGETMELVAERSNFITERAPTGAPARYGLVNLVELAEFADWPAVSRNAHGLFETAETLKADSPLKAEIARIAAATPDPVRRAELALALVQEQVRYLFIGMNDGGFVPAPADLTWQRRFGDCKGKTALLVALLKGLGIAARPVFVDTDSGDAVARRLPAMNLFDHVLVEAQIGGRSYWLDGTRQGDTRLDRLEVPDYHSGLPATAQGSELVALVPTAPRAPMVETRLDLDASGGVDVPAPAKAEMRARGDTAASWRMKYAGLAPAERERQLRKLWRDTYDFITPQTVAATLDEASGDYVLSMTGSARMEWTSSGSTRWYELDRARVGWKPNVERDGTLLADAPFAFDYPDWWANRETVRLPRGGKDFALQANDVDETVGGLYTFHRKVTLNGDTVTMENDTRALKAELPAADAPKVRDRMAELGNHGQFIRLPAMYEATDGDLAALADDKPALARAWLVRGAAAFDRGDMPGAITGLKATLAIDPRQAPAHALLAFAYASQGDALAGAEADAALAADDKQDMAWAAKGLVALKAKKMPEALAAYDKAIALDPRNPRTLAGRASAHLALGHYAPALADTDAALALAPDLPLRPIRVVALSMLGRRAEALEAVDALLAATPDSRDMRRMRAALRAEDGDQAGAMADTGWLVSHGGTAADYVSQAQMRPRGDKAGRLADANAALRLDPGHVDALLLRAALEQEDKALDAASLDVARAAKLAPGSLKVAAAQMDLMAAQGQSDRALQLAAATLAGHAQDAEAHNLVCWFKATHGLALDSAGGDCEAALRLAPGRPDFLDSRGFLRLRQGDSKGAIADYDSALRIAPALIASLYGRGLAYARLGERDRALADLSRARSLSPDVDKTWAGYGLSPPPGF
ncbi:DUF3857 domain-containing protein [Novosphingobium pokkalii]|uniref:DUF3857 domain-containing protein n=1 Tax=Novosphingobium pokkalii TaxID=1770194 RepID=A0ABV7V620_9SPHN|nr:DUF3857 domain-containing protein [Novosphingobium pokkalii]